MKILHISKNEIPKDLAERFRSGKLSEVFLDTGGFGTLEQVVKFAVQIRDVLEDVPGIFEPVVVGPVTKVDTKSARIFAREIIRVTPLGFQDYLKDLNDF